MTPDRWQRVSSLCEMVIEQPPAARARLLQDACQGDADLRREVESLLAHEGSSVVIDRSVWSIAGEVLDPESLLTPGTNVGAYRIMGVIGAGGMGTVYRARDTTLQRDVALKVLPAAFIDDSDRLARFKREAHTLAALNHPNVGAIHGFEDAGDVHALVLELVEGPTLAERLQRGAIPVREALSIASQIAEGLSAAHEIGIVHRDLKPANIKARDDGTVKLLDFGLARTLEPLTVPAVQSVQRVDRPNIEPAALTSAVAPELTAAGSLLGTLAYMSPEQMHGRPADKRSDIWAFGCVLYEMLSGRRAFDRADAGATRRAVLEDDPDWQALPRDLQRSIRTLIARCLQKDRRLRPGDISAALYVLLEPEDPRATRVAHRVGRRGRWMAPLVATAAVLVLGPSIWPLVRRDTAPVSSVSWLIANPAAAEPLVVSLGRDIDITPDGSLVVYDVGRGEESQLMIRSLNRLEATPLPNTMRANTPFFSWDGKKVGFAVQSEIRTVPVTGGPSTLVAQIVGIPPRGFTWGSDDFIYFATSDRATGLLRVPAAGGEPAVLTRPDAPGGGIDHWHPSALPNGRAILFTIVGERPEQDRIGVLDLSTLDRRALEIQGSHPLYAASGHLVYAAGGSLRAVPFDSDRLQVLGASFAIDERIPDRNVADVDFAVSSTGTLVYIGEVVAPQRSLVWVGRNGREEPIPTPSHAYNTARISPDGRRIAAGVGEAQATIFVADLARQTFTPLNVERGRKAHPIWLDNERLVFVSDRDGPMNLFIQAADGSGRAERLTTSEWGHYPYWVARNPLRVFFTELGIPVRADLGMLALHDRGAELLFETEQSEANPELSPDGRWLAYQWNRQNAPPWSVFVVAFPDVQAQKAFIASGTQPAWSPDGRELLFINEHGRLSAVSVDVHDGRLVPGMPREILNTGYFGGPVLTARPYDVSADGRRFVMIKDVAPGTANIAVVQGWFEKLGQSARGD